MRALAPLMLPVAALAHEGHGAAALHLHPLEVMGLVALAVVGLVALLRYWKR